MCIHIEIESGPKISKIICANWGTRILKFTCVARFFLQGYKSVSKFNSLWKKYPGKRFSQLEWIYVDALYSEKITRLFLLKADENVSEHFCASQLCNGRTGSIMYSRANQRHVNKSLHVHTACSKTKGWSEPSRLGLVTIFTKPESVK